METLIPKAWMAQVTAAIWVSHQIRFSMKTTRGMVPRVR